MDDASSKGCVIDCLKCQTITHPSPTLLVDKQGRNRLFLAAAWR